MLSIMIIKDKNDFTEDFNKKEFVDFLYNHLGRFGDSKDAITKSVDYALSKEVGMGGFLLAAIDKNELISVLVVNKTRMSGYIPENIIVYVAVHQIKRGKGIGTKIIKKALVLCDGDVKLHVEYNNPAKKLYEKLGFKSKYAEMRYKKSK